ncbi:MAG: rcsC [Chitinophagaceae bacterium]|nr:rcsC [Chitinophagaceae bacterium]
MSLGFSSILKLIDRELLKYANNWGEYRRNYICVRLYLFAALILFCDSIFQFSQALFSNSLLSVGQSLVYLFLIFLFYKGKMLLAKNSTFLITNIILFFTASLNGRMAFQHLILIPLIIASVFFYSDREFKYMIAALSLTVLNLIVLELTNYSLFENTMTLSHKEFPFDKTIVVFMTLAFSFYMLYELLRMNTNMEEKLKRLNGSLLVRNTKLKKSNEDLDSFVYRASHDLRSPLASIMGVINIVKTEKDVSKIKDYMKYQERSVKKLDDLIQDILDISRNAKLGVFIEPIELKNFLRSCVDSFSYMEEFSKVMIQLSIPDDYVLYSDARRLKIIFNNILSNALRYYDPTKIQSHINITLRNHNRDVILVFEDNGIGIMTEHITKVFDMFYRATNQNTGSGLGLYIVKDTMDKLGGIIKIDSVNGEGTNIQLYIPKGETESEKDNKQEALDGISA